MDKKKRSKIYWISFGIIWFISAVVIIGILFYNAYLSRVYLKNSRLTFTNALEIVNDPWYFFWFFIGLVNIFALIASASYIVIRELNYFNKAFPIIWLAPLINLIILVILIWAYSNPILLAFTFVAAIGGAFMFISSSN